MIPNFGNAIIESQIGDRVIELDSRIETLEQFDQERWETIAYLDDESKILRRELIIVKQQNRTLMRLIEQMAMK